MRIAAALVVLGALGVLLLVPLHPEAFLVGAAFHATPPDLHWLAWDTIEWGGNVVVFAVVAIALSIVIRHPVAVAVIAVGASAACEIAQVWIPHRVPSVSDFAFNALGSVVGVGLVAFVHRRSAVRRAQPERN